MNSERILIELSDAVPAADREELFRTIADDFDLQLTPSRKFGVDWTLVVCVLKDGAAIAGGISALANLATALIKWREATKAKGTSCEVIVKRRNSSGINLETSTDENIRNALKVQA